MATAQYSYLRAEDLATAGLQCYRNLSLGVTGSIVKAAGGRLYAYDLHNASNAIEYVKAYNKATAPTEADTPLLTIAIEGGETKCLDLPQGASFPAGLSLRGTTGVADNDTGAPSSGDLVVNLFFK